jgi:membrane fusion protein, macrolide-specific efflux system
VTKKPTNGHPRSVQAPPRPDPIPGNGLVEGEPRRPNVRRRAGTGTVAIEEPGLDGQPEWPVAPRASTRKTSIRRSAEILFAVLLLAGVVTAVVWVVRGAFFGGPGAFGAVVGPPSITYLQFPSEGQITQVEVHPGELVKRGQVLGTQNTTLLQLRLSSDQASLAIDQATVAGDQAIAAAVPKTQSAQQHSLGLEVTLAQQQLSGAESELAVALTPQERAAAGAAVTVAQTRIALAENALVNASSSSSTIPALSAAQAAVARDQAAVASDQVALQGATLTAPADGVIAYVGGSVGDLAGVTGVSGGSIPGVAVPTSSGFNLFPPAPQAPSAGTQGATQPMFAFYANAPWEAVAVVPQASIFSVRVGESGQVTLAGRNETLRAHVVRINMSPVYTNGTASYDVILSLDQGLGSQLLGMAADVTLGGSH